MTNLPNPWLAESSSRSADATAAAPENSPSLPAAVALNRNSALAPEAPLTELLADHHAKHHRFRLDERAFAEALEEPPMFLRTAGFCR